MLLAESRRTPVQTDARQTKSSVEVLGIEAFLHHLSVQPIAIATAAEAHSCYSSIFGTELLQTR
eukprot:SAG31_NODE_13_length_37961_cov_21.751307_42_plen_64_part_00